MPLMVMFLHASAFPHFSPPLPPLMVMYLAGGQALRAGVKGTARSNNVAPQQCEEAEGRVQSGEAEGGGVQGREAVGEAQSREAEAGAEAEADGLRGDSGGGSGGKERGEEEDTDMGDIEEGGIIMECMEEDGVDVGSISDESIALLWTIQQRHDPLSFYAPFFNSLPAAINTALTWPEAAVRAVQGTLLHTHIERARQHIRAEYHSLFPALSQRHPTLFPPALFSLSAFTAAAELWYAYAMRIALPSPPPPPHAAAASPPSAPSAAAAAPLLSMQGAWQLGGGGAGQAGETTALPCLVPLASLLNHSVSPDSRFQAGRGIAGGACMEGYAWRGMHGGVCMEGHAWRGMHGGICTVTTELKQILVQGCVRRGMQKGACRKGHAGRGMEGTASHQCSRGCMKQGLTTTHT
ncbi:unnamed protein product [Closterium sp. NIES-53]